MTDSIFKSRTSVEPPNEINSERALRPTRLADYVGQAQMRSAIEVMIGATKKREEALDHVLLYGPPGLGKTTMANIIANELGVNIRHTSGPAVERAGDLVAILTALQPRDVLFIDEIHRLRNDLEEILYSALEDYAIDIVTGSGATPRTLRLSLAPFTCIGATTRAGSITGPLRDRFGAAFRLEFYQQAELEAIITRSAGLLKIGISPAATILLAACSRGTPRFANRLLRRARDEAQVQGLEVISVELAQTTLTRLQIDGGGLDPTDQAYLDVLAKTFKGGPAGVAALAASLAEDVLTVEDVIEPYLLRLGLIARTLRGRILTPEGKKYLKK